VNCLCYSDGQEDILLPPGPNLPEDIRCLYNTNPNDFPEPKIFASGLIYDDLGNPIGNKTPLWEPIKDDLNEIKDEIIGIETQGEYQGQEYKKYLMTNNNYLITYRKLPTEDDSSTRITTLYFRAGQTEAVHRFINQRHCNTQLIGTPKKVSAIEETFISGCENILHGIFQFQDIGENTPPDTPAPSGMYEGFMGSVTGGVLIKYTELYFGIFQFLDKNEPIRPDRFSPSGFYEGFNLSKLDMAFGEFSEQLTNN
jgi:hypothetical protein